MTGAKLKKHHWIVLTLIFLVWLDWYIRSPSSEARHITSAIEEQASAKLKSYPYKFWVMKVASGTAVVSTPRNFDVPAFKVLSLFYPEINTKDPNNPEFIAVEQLLGEVQAEVRNIVLGQPGIRDMRWELDREWLKSKFIEVPDKR